MSDSWNHTAFSDWLLSFGNMHFRFFLDLIAQFFLSINNIPLKQKYKLGEKKTSLLSKVVWESWKAACKSMKIEHTLTPCMKITQTGLKTYKTPRREP